MTEEESRDDEMMEMMKVATHNITDAAKSLRAIRSWIALWSAVAIIGFIVYTALAMSRV